MVEEFDFCALQEIILVNFNELILIMPPQDYEEDTFDLDSGLGVVLPSTLLFILLFTSGPEAIP